MMKWYWEQATFGGGWAPVSGPDKPSIKTTNGVARIARGEGLGPRVRAVTEIPADHHHLTLGQLFEVYSPDGRFTGGQTIGGRDDG